ncbi:MAG: mannose-6-phosphate isomerase [Candidatus Nanoarchaeia archaeon]|nr:mannose-6-phosphate isomerase [Candidatus Nanoarchaeia archaeon]MDD5741058.1 mannose-6-phosphate isomerase [Candidatus Nanoarchaeia archaeon]
MVKEVKEPWGSEKHFVYNQKCTVKILIVKPNQELSLQYHKKRRELWYFLTDGYVQLGTHKKKVKKREFIEIKNNVAHRLIAKNKEVQVLEIDLGKYDKKDEVRLEDKYGRR